MGGLLTGGPSDIRQHDAGSPKVFFKYFFVNTVTGEKSRDVLAQAKLTNE